MLFKYEIRCLGEQWILLSTPQLSAKQSTLVILVFYKAACPEETIWLVGKDFNCRYTSV